MSKTRLLTTWISLSVFLLFSPDNAQATGKYQLCPVDSTCTIGEFLYDDDYSPYIGASCTLTSRDPSGTLFLNAVSMAGQSDGWYSYDLNTTGETEGLYRSQMCCTAGSDYLCIDKSFEIGQESGGSSLTQEQVASAVLNANPGDYNNDNTIGRNLQNPNLTASEIWNYSTRSLTTFGTLIADFWKYNPTNDSSSQNSAYSQLQSQIQENREILEKLINEPIIKTFLEDGQPPDVKAKIEETRSITNTLYANTQSIIGRLTILSTKWSALPEKELLSELDTLIDELGSDSNSPSDDSILKGALWLENAWANPITFSVANSSQSTLNSLLTLREDLDYFGKSKTPTSNLTSALLSLKELEESIGDVSNDTDDATLFGHLKKIQLRAQALDEQELKLEALLDEIDSTSQIELTSSLNKAEEEILALNEFESAIRILGSKFGTAKQKIKNRIFGLDAIVDINRSLLAGNPNDPVQGIWLEEGSIVFRSIITNPSKSISQDVTLKYFLPAETREEHIIDIDPSLKVAFDTTENTLYVEGDYTLEPDESIIVFLELEDIWYFEEEELSAYRKEAEELLNSLEKTSFFTQASTLKSDIDLSLDKILSAQDESDNPGNRIRTYRENQLELLSVIEKLENLKNLVAQSDSESSIKGFIGGSQAIAVWAIIVVFIGGFAFMTYHMRRLQSRKRKFAKSKSTKTLPAPSSSLTPQRPAPALAKTRPSPSLETPSRPALLPIAVITLITAAISTIIFTLLYTRYIKSPQTPEIAPIEAPESTIAPEEPEPTSEALSDDNERIVIGQSETELVMLTDNSNNLTVDVYSSPSLDSDIVMSLKTETELYIFSNELDEDDNLWMKVGFAKEDDDKNWWILSDNLIDL